MMVDSNQRWIGLTAAGRPIDLEALRSGKLRQWSKFVPDAPPPIYDKPFTWAYGLYSRHGRFLPALQCDSRRQLVGNAAEYLMPCQDHRQMHSKVYRRANDILDSPVGPDFVALNVRLGKCFGMEDVSAEVWRHLSNPSTVDELCARLGQAYQVNERTCRSDVADLLAEMTEAGLVEVRDQG